MFARILGLAGLFAVFGCTSDATSSGGTVLNADPEVPHDVWASLSGKSVFFGHQSVGGNILEGIEDLRASTSEQPQLSVTSVSDGQTVGPGTWVETAIGVNGEPDSKLAAFTSLLTQVGSEVDIAFMKFCYLDFTPQTDPGAVFEAYRATVAQVRRDYPELTLMHVTAPLTVAEPTLRHVAKRLLGRTTQADLNRKRNQYNDALRREFAGEPIFDLALLESTGADGSRASIRVEGESVPVLAPEWTSDGGHLNAEARRRVALELLSFVSGL